MTNVEKIKKKFENDMKIAKMKDEISKQFNGLDSMVFLDHISLEPLSLETAIKVINRFNPEPLYVLRNKLGNGYGPGAIRTANYTDKTPLEPKFPYILTIDNYRSKLSWYTKMNNKIFRVNMVVPTNFTISYEIDTSFSHGQCHSTLKSCSLAYPKDIGLDKFNFTKQTWGSCDANPYSYGLWINREPQAYDQDTAENILKAIWK